MSSSTERKSRQIARQNGTDRKTVAEREEAAKKKKEKIKWTITGIAVVLFIAAVLYLNSGLFYRNSTAITMDNKALKEYGIDAESQDFSIAEVNYVYNSQLLQIMSSLGDYASYMGLDLSKPLDQQQCSFGAVSEAGEEESKEVYTWDDYFMDATYKHLKELGALTAYAEYKNISLDDDDMKTVQENLDALKDGAKQNGYKSVNKFIAANYGTGCNVALFRQMLEKEALAAKVQETIRDSEEYTDKQLKEKYESVKDSYDTFDYDYYFVAAETAPDEQGNQVASEEALAEAKATADKLLSEVKSSGDFAKAAKSVIGKVENTVTNEDGTVSTETQDAAPTNGKDVPGSQLPPELSEWMLKNHAANDSELVASDTGYYVVVFYERDNNQHTTEESGEMLNCDYIADGLLRDEALSKWLEDVVAGIEKIYSFNDRFAVKYVGR